MQNRLILVCAMKEEARGFIDRFHLKKEMDFPYLEVFRSRDQKIWLVITGIGRLKAAMGTTALLMALSERGLLEPAVLVNIGLSGAKDLPAGEVVLCHTLIRKEGFPFHPDLPVHPFKEAALVTEDEVVTKEIPEDPALFVRKKTAKALGRDCFFCYDMEGTAVFEAAARFLKTDRILVVKVISDALSFAEGKEQGCAVLKQREEEIAAYLTGLSFGIFHKKHIYVEAGCEDLPFTEKILSRYPDTPLVPILHYTHIFNRPRQPVAEQKKNGDLILARNTGRLFYPGSFMCQSFGHQEFFYTSLAKNCCFDCAYCYLQGMFSTGNVLMFVNLQDYEEELSRMGDRPLYVNVSFDTDLGALPAGKEVLTFLYGLVMRNPHLTIEVRTKAALPLPEFSPSSRMIFAFTVSPEKIHKLEHKTPEVALRLQSAKRLAMAGFPVRLVFDPVITELCAVEEYEAFFTKVFQKIYPEELLDVSIGGFRMGKKEVSALRKREEDTAWLDSLRPTKHSLVSEPDGVERVKKALLRFLPAEKIYVWEEGKTE